MAINYAAKYSAKVDEKFTLQSVTNAIINNEYDWAGVDTVNVYSIPTSALNDYALTGSSRYGTPAELQDTVQTMKLSRDRSFTFTIDRRNYNDTMLTKESGRALSRQLDEQVIPEVDIYRIATLAANAGTSVSALSTKDNAYEQFLDATAKLTDSKVPQNGRVAFVSPAFYKAIKLDGSFIKASDVAQNMLITGMVGMIDNVRIVQVPTSYLPTNVSFIVTHAVAMVSPQKLSEYKTHDNPPGINGWLVEGRIYYDAFVLENKKNAVYVHVNEADED